MKFILACLLLIATFQFGQFDEIYINTDHNVQQSVTTSTNWLSGWTYNGLNWISEKLHEIPGHLKNGVSETASAIRSGLHFTSEKLGDMTSFTSDQFKNVKNSIGSALNYAEQKIESPIHIEYST